MAFLKLILEVIAGIALILALFYKFCFLRDPLRLAPSGSNITSPADGRIIGIKELSSKNRASIKKGKGRVKTALSDIAKNSHMVTIFMTPFDAHYQRAPYDGKVICTHYTKGRFSTADRPRPENENNQILIKTRIGSMKVIQIAGFMARRIVCFVRRNQNIKKGQKLGMIRLGSQVCLILPNNKNICLSVKKGDRVKAGESIIAVLK